MLGAILVVDDKPETLSILSTMLDKEGFEVSFATNAETALRLAERVQPDLILLDVMMPGMDGFEACRRLKAHDRTAEIPVIFMTSLTETEEKVKGFAVGAIDYVTKPLRLEEVLARVKTHLSLQRLQRDLKAKNAELLDKQAKLEEDIRAAAQIQKSLFPRTPPGIEHFRFAWRFIPCEQIGGDLFNIYRLDESHLAIYMFDVAGHGIPAAMVTVHVSQALLPKIGSLTKKAAQTPPYYTITAPIAVLKELDRNYPLEQFNKHLTIVYLVLNHATGQIRYSNAAHPMPVIVKVNGELKMLEARGSVIGLGEFVPFEEDEIRMQPGDRLFLYTDGITECVNQRDESYGEQRFYEELRRTRQIALDDACEQIIASVLEYSGATLPQDDITLFAIECYDNYKNRI